MNRAPLVLAHRGASAYAPENTLAAFDLALVMGARALETDVRATSDGHLVLLHDEGVDRTTDGAGRVAELSLAQVEALDAGQWRGLQWRGERVPTLAALLARYGHRALLRLEVKAPAIEPAVLAAVQAAGCAANVEFTSFAWDTVVALARLHPGCRLGWLVQEVDEATVSGAIAIGLNFVSARADALTEAALQRGRAAGLEVGAWGVRDDGLLEHVVGLGVDSFTSNWPDRALRRTGN